MYEPGQCHNEVVMQGLSSAGSDPAEEAVKIIRRDPLYHFQKIKLYLSSVKASGFKRSQMGPYHRYRPI